MPYTAAGPVAIAVSAAASLLANTPYFLTWTGAANPTAAAANIFTGEIGYPIEQLAITSDVLTVTTRETHNLAVNQVISLQGPTLGPQGLNLDGQHTIASVPTANSFTVATTAANLAASTPPAGFVLPSSQPVACIAETGGGEGINATIIGTGGAAVFSGSIDIFFENVIPAQYENDPVNAIAQALSEHGQLVAGIAYSQGTGDLMCLNDIKSIATPTFISMSEQADNTIRFERWRSAVRCTWGLKS